VEIQKLWNGAAGFNGSVNGIATNIITKCNPKGILKMLKRLKIDSTIHHFLNQHHQRFVREWQVFTA
jgi:hypothetical protein